RTEGAAQHASRDRDRPCLGRSACRSSVLGPPARHRRAADRSECALVRVGWYSDLHAGLHARIDADRKTTGGLTERRTGHRERAAVEPNTSPTDRKTADDTISSIRRFRDAAAQRSAVESASYLG